MKKSTVLIIKMGNTYPEINIQFGGFDDLIINSADQKHIKWKVLDILDVYPEEVNSYDAVILTGAHASVTKHYPYLEGMERVLLNIIDHEIPCFGICFGHQLIHKLLGGKVIRNPLGQEFGVTELFLTMDGRSDKNFYMHETGKIEVYESHTDIVLYTAADVTQLAWNESNQYQATRYKDFIYTVQFHPEFNKSVMESYICKNRDLIKNDRLNVQSPEKLLKKNKELVHSAGFLKSFFNLVKSDVIVKK